MDAADCPDRPDHPDSGFAALVRQDRVHRDLYLSQALFEQERRRLFANTWNFVAHASQLPSPGDYRTTEFAGRPLVVLRDAEGEIRVLMNRCPHKGARLLDDTAGNVGRMIRCPYHGWAFRTDGRLAATPLKSGYAGTGFDADSAEASIVPVGNVAVHRGFVFVRLARYGVAFADYFGPALAALDNLADRSPVGELEVVGEPVRNLLYCNWKTYLENINDSVHPVSAHESATAVARKLWRGKPEDAPKPMAIEQILPFGSSYEFFDGMGGRVMPNGHSFLGVNFNIHTSYAGLEGYEAAMRAAYGEQRAAQILGFRSQNSILYPLLSVKSSPPALRVLRPLAADRTVLEAWSLRPKGAPDVVLERAIAYNRLAFSPMSIVAHDDVHLFESIQSALAADGNDWVSLHRDHREIETGDADRVVNGTSEALMRNQFRAWARYMDADAYRREAP